MSWEIDIHDSIEEKIACDGYSSLHDSERSYHALRWLFFVAYGPGLLDYFNGTPHEQIEFARRGLGEIGADEMLTELDNALALLPADFFDDGTSNKELAEALTDEIYKCECRLTDLPYPARDLIAFVNDHDAEFQGPRTKLELWASKYRRGANTAPTFTVKKFDAAKEAEKDRAYSTRSCPNCDYPSPDYRPTCKSCGYPHGKA